MNSHRAIDWTLVLAWSIGHAILTALVNRTAANADVTFDAVLLDLGARRTGRWIGRCKTCRKAHRVDGVQARGRVANRDHAIIVAGSRAFLTADHGSNPSALFVGCCGPRRVRLDRVYDDARPSKPRHECNAKCLASTGPACECKCRGANHGASAVAA